MRKTLAVPLYCILMAPQTRAAVTYLFTHFPRNKTKKKSAKTRIAKHAWFSAESMSFLAHFWNGWRPIQINLAAPKAKKHTKKSNVGASLNVKGPYSCQN